MSKIQISNQPFSLEAPTPAEFRGWLDQKTGKYFILWLKNEMLELQECWANGDFTGDSTEKTIQLNSEAIGKINQIANILLNLDEMKTNEESDEDPDES